MTPRNAAALRTETPGAAAEQPAGPGLHTLLAATTQRLDTLLASALAGCSRTSAQRLIAGGLVTVDGRTVEKVAHRVSAGESVTVRLSEPRPSMLVPEEMQLDVVYEDADLLVIDKPAGMVVHPAAGHEAHTLVHGLLARCHDLAGIGGEQRPGIVHRLDRDTSGLLMVAKNDRAHASLSRQLQARTVGKFYLALLSGAPRPASGIVDAPIARDPHERKRMAIRDGGRPSRTRYHTVSQAGGYALVVAGLETGRTHQLRVHFAALGCPVAGDPIYGVAGGPAGRLWLHAWRLGFDRPSDGRRIVLETQPPMQLSSSWRALMGTGAAAGVSAAEGEDLEQVLGRARGWAADEVRGTVTAAIQTAEAPGARKKEKRR